MVTKRFKNLNKDKQSRILDALLNEFTNHTLADAQVSRIVAESGIARGAFYKYFDDLKDSYEFLYHQALREIHQNIKTSDTEKYDPDTYVQQTKDFVDESTDSRYFGLVKMHMLYNESFFISTFDNHLINGNEYLWATQVIIHDAIKQIMIDPSAKEMILNKLSNVLRTLAKKDE